MRGSMLLLLLIALGLLGIAIAAKRTRADALAYDAAQRNYAATLAAVEELGALREQRERVLLRERPTQDVIAQLSSVLAEVGLPSSTLRNLIPESDVAMGPGQAHSGLRKQSLRVQLEPMQPADLGRFLHRWSQSQSLWTTTRIELVRPTGRSAVDNHYATTLIMSAAYFESR